MLKNSGRIVQPRFFKALFLLDDRIFVILRLEIIYIGNCRPEQQQKMRIVKRLYLFILKSFLPLFAMTFFIVLFIVLMQFLWKYIDDLVGKGLSVSLIAELFSTPQSAWCLWRFRSLFCLQA